MEIHTQCAELGTGCKSSSQAGHDVVVCLHLQVKVEETSDQVNGGARQDGAVRQDVHWGSCRHNWIHRKAPPPAIH